MRHLGLTKQVSCLQRCPQSIQGVLIERFHCIVCMCVGGSSATGGAGGCAGGSQCCGPRHR